MDRFASGLGRAITCAAFLAALSAVAMPRETAAQPTPMQASALRQSCGADYGLYCSSIAPGTPAALQCLQVNANRLSAPCQQAVAALGAQSAAAPVTPPAAPPGEAQSSALRAACGHDFRARCSGVAPGGSEAFACLQQNLAGLSPSCQKAVAAAGVGAPAAAAPPPALRPPPAPAASGQAAIKQASGQAAIKQACGKDYRAHCAGVPSGGSAALACLQQNAPALSSSCQKALAAAGGAAPPAASPAPRPGLREACAGDARTYCADTEPGGIRAMMCLRRNEQRLSQPCQEALMAMKAGLSGR